MDWYDKIMLELKALDKQHEYFRNNFKSKKITVSDKVFFKFQKIKHPKLHLNTRKTLLFKAKNKPKKINFKLSLFLILVMVTLLIVAFFYVLIMFLRA